MLKTKTTVLVVHRLAGMLITMPNKEKDKDVVKGWVGLRGGSGQVLACLVRRAGLERFFLAVCPALFGRNVLTGLPVLLGVAWLVRRGGGCLH